MRLIPALVMALALPAMAGEQPPSFRLDVMPIFMNAGCDTGGCHGAARGKDGFRLSLFGYDPEGDYQRITREMVGRRINLALPEDSLLLTKATGVVAHTGGKRFEKGSDNYSTLLRWIAAGAPDDPPNVPRVVAVELSPNSLLLEGEGKAMPLTVKARYSDGSVRDVTRLAVYSTNNDASALVSSLGVVTGGRWGEAFILARYDVFNVGAGVITLPANPPAIPADYAASNYIDEHVNAKLKKLRMRPSELAGDAAFARRVYIDLVGQLPPPQRLEEFTRSSDPKKRERLVDELLSRREFTELWVMKWAELLQVRSADNRVSYKAALQYFNWLDDRISSNVPFDQIVQELLSATGGTFANPATNYYQVENDTLKVAENTAQVFMGMRIQCAQCHNHPFDRWTMDDYYGFTSFFTQVGRKRGEDPRETIVFNSGGGEVNHPLSGKPVPATFLGAGAADLKGRDRREVLAKWIASSDNPYFARNLVNIVWAHFFGRGIVEPVDDVRVSNAPSNPELLDALAKSFTESRYNLRQLVRDICLSRTYQLASQANATNEHDARNFSHAAIRRIRAEILLDCINQVTEGRDKFKGLPLGARAVQIADGQTSNYFLTTFGRATRETVCSCEVVMEPNLSQALHLLNGDTVNRKIAEGGVVKRLVEAKLDNAQVVTELYLRALSRPPTAQELEALTAQIPADPAARQKALEDVLWAILNSREFIFNH